MKKIALGIACVLMSLVAIYYILTLTNLNTYLTEKEHKEKQNIEQTVTADDAEYSDYERKLMKEENVSQIGYMNEEIYSCGYTFKVTSVERYNTWQEIGFPEMETDYEGAVDQFEYYTDGFSYIAVHIIITNQNAETYFADNNYQGNNDLKVDLCLGNIGYEMFDENAKYLYAASAIYNTNDQNYPFSKSGYMYDLDIGESYEGMLVYPISDEVEEYAREGLAFGFVGDKENNMGNKIILLEERP